jgi:hypothetical protein
MQRMSVEVLAQSGQQHCVAGLAVSRLLWLVIELLY